MKTSSAKPLLLAAAFLVVAVSGVKAQTWSFTGNMNVARVLPTATLLNHGEVLVTGSNRGGDAFSSAKLYTPPTGTFSYTGSMNTGRAYHAAALLPNGEVLIVGGETLFPTNCRSSAELYNPPTGPFSYTGSLSAGYCAATATLLNTGKVLVTNGTNAELSDPSSGTLSVIGSFKVSRTDPTTTLLGNGKVSFTGGFEGTTNYLKSGELYDPSSGSFSYTGSLTDERDEGARAVLLDDGAVLVIGGEWNYRVYRTHFWNTAEIYQSLRLSMPTTSGPQPF